MAQGTHGKAGQQWQKQANHFQAIITSAQAVLDDPASTDEDKAEATQTIADMQKNLARLSSKYGVTPTA
jgi:phage terminase small subunit